MSPEKHLAQARALDALPQRARILDSTQSAVPLQIRSILDTIIAHFPYKYTGGVKIYIQRAKGQMRVKLAAI